MDGFKDRVAIVTGGADGIGRALCKELGRRGAVVVVADINAEGARQVASAIAAAGDQAHAAHLDVSRAEDVREHGRLDNMFNNAGIGIVAEMRDMDLEHWRRILDVNLWGVIYSATAAYPVMVKQGFGHVVNTSSAAGLLPAALGTAYAASKHAVVGLSISLRAEAAALGVKVRVVCPGLVRTNIWNAVTYVKVNPEAVKATVSSIKMSETADCARVTLRVRGVARNQAIIVVIPLARLSWWLYRLHPALYDVLARKMVGDFRALRKD